MGQPSGTVTFLFTDIEGSTRRWEERTEAMGVALARHDDILRRAIEGNGGVVFKTVGDAFCAAFGTAPEGLAAAVDAQLALGEEDWAQSGELRVRMALHTGAAEVRDEDYFGPTLNRVARLLAAGHGGQVLLSEATAGLVRDALLGLSLTDMGEHRLKDLIRPERIFQLGGHGLREGFPALKTLDTRPNNLPAQATPFIGRDAVVEAILAQVRRPEVRLLTLLGPGGAGKTRLSLHLGAELLDEYEDGVFFVPLAEVTEAEQVVVALAQALGVRLGGGDGRGPLEAVKEFLKNRQVLLVLDNFEQLLYSPPGGASPAGASVVSDVLAACQRVKALVTSRSALRVYGERELPVPPLGLPDPKRLPELSQLTQYEAVRLFIERAQAVKPDFQVTNENAPAVAEICVRLDGLPLGIELAAARVRLLSPQAMLARLERRLALLTGGARDLPARQQTLRGAIDWSYDLLDEGEKRLFRRLAVFGGGSTLEAMERVAGEEVDALEGIESLVSKSLVQQREGEDGEPRFTMLATIREYAAEKLADVGEAEGTRRRHLEHFLRLAEEAQPRLQSGEQDVWLDRLEAEHDNFRTALRWVRERAEDAELTQLGLRLCVPLFWFWQLRGHWAEGHGWIEDVLRLPHAAARTAARARNLSNCGVIDAMMKQLDEAEGLLTEAYEIARELGDRVAEAEAVGRLGYVALERPDLEVAAARYAESLRLARETGQRVGEAAVLMGMGNLALARGELGAAREGYEAALALRRAVGDKWGLGQTLGSLAELHAREQRYGEAMAALEQALGLYLELRSNGNIAMVLAELAGIFIQKEEEAFRGHALTLVGAASALFEAVGLRVGAEEMATHDPRLAGLAALLEEPLRRERYERGRSMSAAEAVRVALEEHPPMAVEGAAAGERAPVGVR